MMRHITRTRPGLGLVQKHPANRHKFFPLEAVSLTVLFFLNADQAIVSQFIE
jgi:hypothetical protein